MAEKSKKLPKGTQPDPATLTERQRRILDIIQDALVLRGYPPSIREIGDACGLQSTSSVSYQLKELERKGFLRRDPNKPRAVDVRNVPESKPKPGPQAKLKSTNRVPLPEKLREFAADAAYIPIVGSIAAGAPITAEQNVDTYLPLPQSIVGEGELFMLEVRGESMRDAGILNGDWVVIRSQPVVEPGEFAAALLDGEATVKEFHKDASGIWLLPHNEDFDPIPGEEATIMGKVVTVLRKL